jgi:hypothetical protein
MNLLDSVAGRLDHAVPAVAKVERRSSGEHVRERAAAIGALLTEANSLVKEAVERTNALNRALWS